MTTESQSGHPDQVIEWPVNHRIVIKSLSDQTISTNDEIMSGLTSGKERLREEELNLLETNKNRTK